MKFMKLNCEGCKTVFIADDTKHHIDICPKCKKSGVDFEEHYCRWWGKLKIVNRFDPPYFDSDDDYHSALLTWLEDSDEEYILEKDDVFKILTIIRL